MSKISRHPNSFLSKAKFVPLLKIIFENEAGESDSTAFLVKNLSAVQEAVETKIN